MESTCTAAWAGPYELELAKNWTAEDDAQVWAPAVGDPYLQYGSIANIFGSSCSLQPYVIPASSCDSSGGQQQLVDYNYYAAAAQHHDPDPMEAYRENPEKLFKERREEFMNDAKLMMKIKMHRYPPSIQALGDGYTEPKFVAIGPYHHRRHDLQETEKMKHMAAHYCIEKCKSVRGLSVQDMYYSVVSVAENIDAWGLYDKDVMAGFHYEKDFLPIMFYDACFLVMYILGGRLEPELVHFIMSKRNYIRRDIMLLENQIPLQVFVTVMEMCTPDPLQIMKEFVEECMKGFLQDRVVFDGPGVHSGELEDCYNKAPHLLGLLRFFAVGKRSRKHKLESSDLENMESISISASANELAEIGISLTADETTALADMGLAKKWIIFKKLSMAPLSLDDTRARLLVNMAALELCTTPKFSRGEFEDSAICSYLLLLSMLVHRKEDVHELRTWGILQGAGLSDRETLDFFTSLQGLSKGRCYVHLMFEIQSYRDKRPRIIKLYAFVYNNWKYIVAVGSAIAAFIGIITALMTFKGALGH